MQKPTFKEVLKFWTKLGFISFGSLWDDYQNRTECRFQTSIFEDFIKYSPQPQPHTQPQKSLRHLKLKSLPWF